MQSILLTHGVEPLLLSYGAHADPLWSEVSVRDIDHASRLIGGDANGVWRMRALLASGGETDVARLDDHEVMRRVAQMLAAHRLVLRRHAAAAPAARASAGAGASASAAAAPAARRTGAVSSAPRAASDSGSAEQPEYAVASQDRQAATLRQAAGSGTPFCEICEQRKAARMAAAQR